MTMGKPIVNMDSDLLKYNAKNAVKKANIPITDIFTDAFVRLFIDR